MKTSTFTGALGILALLGSSVGTAATVTVTPTNPAPLLNLGDQIVLTLDATAFTNNVGGITLDISFNDSVVSFVSGALPAAGPLAAATGTILQVNTGAQPVDRIANVLPGTQIPTGAFTIATFTFQAVGAGLANIVFNDDGGASSGFFDNTTADYIPVDYTQANVSVVPAPATLGLLASGVVGLVVRSVRRRRAAA